MEARGAGPGARQRRTSPPPRGPHPQPARFPRGVSVRRYRDRDRDRRERLSARHHPQYRPGYYPILLGIALYAAWRRHCVQGPQIRGRCHPVMKAACAPPADLRDCGGGRLRPSGAAVRPGSRHRRAVVISSFAGRDISVMRMALLSIGMVAAVLARVHLSARPVHEHVATLMEFLDNLALGFSVALSPITLLYCADRRVRRHVHRRAARHRPDRDRRHAVADHLPSAPDRGADHARRHLLRRHVWRLDHLDPAAAAGRRLLGGDRGRGLSDGAAGPRRHRAGDDHGGLVLRRLRRHCLRRHARAAARPCRA